jgi:hypothetical protein
MGRDTVGRTGKDSLLPEGPRLGRTGSAYQLM